MGFFSWKTCDTKQPVWNRHSRHKTKPVYLIDDKGNKWCETCYEGYGEFNGQDYYALVDVMNGGTGDRSNGVRLELEIGEPDVKLPRIVEDPTLTYDDLPYPPANHVGQGYWDWEE
jgi:hypothetical protein